MLQVTIPATEQWDESTESFINSKEQKLLLEHSLVSVAKWESKWNKPFLSDSEKLTREESIDYIRCMTLNKDVDPDIYKRIPNNIMEKISEYISAPMSATILPKEKGRGSREPVTSELIYYWMVALTIPFECQKWHLNRLINLIGICNIKNAPPKKRSQRDIMSRNAALNASRRKRLNSRG